MIRMALAGAAIFFASTCGGGRDDSATASSADRTAPTAGVASAASTPRAPGAAAAPAARAPLSAKDSAFYMDMARASLAYLTNHYQSATGLVNATPDWANTTMWDVGGQLLGFLSARQLGLISQADFDTRMQKTLGTLEHLKLFRNAAYAKLYSTRTGAISSEGRAGWSATDLGRFLLALKIVAVNQPQYAAQIERIAKRMDFSQIVQNGYLHGQLIGSNGKPWTFQEGRVGYEQYVATGFSEWGANVDSALSLRANGQRIQVLGATVMSDKRYQDRLLSEPFILDGLEVGLTGDMKTLAQGVLAAQEARYKTTGKMTAVSEDAVGQPPDYFYYFCVLCDAKPFVVETAEGHSVDTPHWISTKAAFGWQALMPDEYTKSLADYLAPARDPKLGWASGVYEGTHASTKTYDVNSSSVLLEIAAYQLGGGRPLMSSAGAAH